jgi:hypothetical protein
MVVFESLSPLRRMRVMLVTMACALIASLFSFLRVIDQSKIYVTHRNNVVFGDGSARYLSNTTTDDQLSNDDHSSSTSHESLFGGLHTMKPSLFLLSLLIVIGAVLIVEYLFHWLQVVTDDSPFRKVVTALEKELMIVGCTAFIFKISLTGSSFISLEWLFALEFSDLLVPILSFTNCIIAVFLVMSSLWQCETWTRAFHRKLDDILDSVIDEKGNTLIT